MSRVRHKYSRRAVAPERLCPAIHRALGNPDILREIFGHLSNGQDELARHPSGQWRRNKIQSSTRRQLAWVAQCCKAFSEPALDALWKKMDDLIPLFKLLSTFQLVNDVYMILGTISDHDWSRFKQYAHRVKELVYFPRKGPSASLRIDSSIHLQLGRRCGTVPLLPSLRALWCSTVAEILFLPASTLSHVNLAISRIGEENIVPAFLHALAAEKPSLKSLTISGRPTERSLDPIRNFEQLHSLILPDVASVDNGWLFAISDIAQLTKLHVHLSSQTNMVKCSEGFRSLERLHVGGTIQQITGLLGAFCIDTLMSIELSPAIDDRTRYTESQWFRCFEKVSSSFPSLRNIRVLHFNYRSSQLASLGYIVEPLLLIRGLEYVDLALFPSLSISDEDIEKIATAWPNLMTLNLPEATPTLPTFASLLHLANFCPRLTSLRLTIDACDLSTHELPPRLTNPLRSWKAGDTEVGNPALLARYLMRIFPSLNQVNGAGMIQQATVFDFIRLGRDVIEDQRLRQVKHVEPAKSIDPNIGLMG